MLERLPDNANCNGLPPEVADKYFNARRRSFEATFAKAICARCAVVDQCLISALAKPPLRGIQAGRDAYELRAIQSRMMREHGTIGLDLLHEDEELNVPPTLRLRNKNGRISDQMRERKERRLAS